MKKINFLILLIVFSVSCKKKTVMLPKVPLQGIGQITNHSQIWLFYNEKDGSFELNEKNRISSTHWFFNIDKRLLLKDVIPVAVRLVDKHNNKSPHNTKPMSNYFSFANSLNDKLSFYQFDSIKYQFIAKSKLPNYSGDTVLVNVNSASIKVSALNKNTIILAAFNANLSFQDYLSAKAELTKNMDSKQISLTEYIVTE